MDDAQILIRISVYDGLSPVVPHKRRVKEGGRLALQPMGRERMVASVPGYPTSLANAGKMPAPLEAGASRTSSGRSPKIIKGSGRCPGLVCQRAVGSEEEWSPWVLNDSIG